MKKYTLILLIGGFFYIPQMRAMERKAIPTNLSTKEEKEIRQAMINYKKNRSRAKAEQIINMYNQLYPNDKLIKAKMNEKKRFDYSSVGPKFGQQEPHSDQKEIQESQIQEEQSCSICMEYEDLKTIPCNNNHTDLICDGCLAQIKNQTNTCPICRGPLIE